MVTDDDDGRKVIMLNKWWNHLCIFSDFKSVNGRWYHWFMA